MNGKSLSNYYAWAIKLLLFVIPFLSLWISKSMFFPYITGRNFTFRILIEIALVLWVALAVFNKEYRPKMTWIVWAVLIFTAVVGLADLLGVDTYASFWSRLERMEGYLMILHLATYFLILTNVFRTKKDWFLLFNLFVIAGIFVGGYGVLQVLGLKEAIQGGGTRIDGTIGNPTYLAAYLTLVMAAALILLFNAGKRWLKYFYSSAIIFSFIIMYFTATRGATLALLVTIPVFLVLYLLFFKGEDSKEKIFRKVAIAGLVLIVLLPTLLWLLRGTALVQESEVLSRLTSVSFGEKTIKSRFLIWGIAWKAFLERPILGWGQENFLQAFSKYYDPRLYDQEPWFDRPHNIVFEWLINAGIIGLFSYLGMFAALYWGILRLLKKNLINKKEGLVMLIFPLTYFLQNFFVFDNFNTYVIFFGFLAYVNSLVVRSEETKPAESEKDLSKTSLTVFLAGLALMSVVIYFVNIKPILVARGIITSLTSTTITGDPVKLTLESFQKTLSYGTFGKGEAVEQLARSASILVNQQGIPASSKLPFLQFAINELELYSRRFPDNVRIHLMLANLYHSVRGFNPQLIFEARKHLEAALLLSPAKHQILFLFAENYLLNNETNKAIEVLQKAANLEPSFREGHINLAIIGILSGRLDIVNESIEKLNNVRLTAIDKKIPQAPLWNYITDLNRIAGVYLDAGRRSNTQTIYNIIKSLEPDILSYSLEKDLTVPYRELLQSLADRIRE